MRHTSLTETLGTVRTSERFLFVMEPLMSNQIRVTDVPFATLRTSMGFCTPMYVEVTGEVASLDEGLGTYFAAESLILLKSMEKLKSI